MRLILLIFSIAFGYQSITWSQSKPLSLDVEREALPEIMRKIEHQTGMTFSYDPAILNPISPVTFKAENLPITECLARLFQNLPVSYKINGKHIILKRRPRTVTISGFVRDKATTEYLIGASVYDSRTQKGAATNNHGFFSLTLPAGAVRLETSYIGYGRYTHTFQQLERDTVMEILLAGGEELAEVIVTGNNATQNPIQAPQMGSMKVTQKTIKTIPTLFGEADVIKALQTLPGVSAGTEGLAGMYVRGGNGDENLYMIDGIQLYQVNHLGGLFSAFNAEALKDVDFYKSAFPARYGGRLSSVVDVHTKDGNRKAYHGSVMLGLTSGSLNLEGPIIKDRTSFNASVRRTWLDALSAPALAICNKVWQKNGDRISARYAFTDVNLKVNHTIDDRSQAYVNFYFGQDFLKGGSTRFAIDEESPFENKSIGKMRWGNIALSSGWSYVLNNKIFGTVTLAYSRYQSRLKQKNSETYNEGDDEHYSSRFIETSTKNGINDLGVHVNFDYMPTPKHHIRYGTDYLYHHFSPEYIEEKTSANITPTKRASADEQLPAHEFSVYAEDDWTINPIVRLNAGLRFNTYHIQKKSYLSLDPRFTARFLLSEDLSLKASYARMNQYVHQISESYLSLPTDMWMPVSKKLKPLISDQVSIGAYYNLHKDYSFSAEGYYKWMHNLLDYKDGYNFLPSFVGWEEKLAAGKGWAYGAELIARKETGPITGWIGYGLMWSDRQSPEINNGKRYPTKYDNRHKLNLVANWKVSEKVELTGSWTFMTGNRVTLAFESYEDLVNWNYNSTHQNLPPGLAPIPPLLPGGGLDYFTERNNVRLPAYHRLDLGINIYRPKKNGHLGIWNISIYNVYCHMNPITVNKRYWMNYDHYFETLSILPIIPSVSYTYKF